MFMANTVGMVFTESRVRGITSSKLWNTDFREFRRVSISGVENLELRQGLVVDFDRSNNINGQNRIYASMDCIPSAPDCVGVQQGVRMFVCST